MLAMAAQEPKISVIIPNWNRADLLPATLDSFLNQTLLPYEIIVVDDGSTDHYPSVVAQYSASHGHIIKYMTHEGKGPGAARNAGFEASTGDYIKFFDSDDLLTRNSLEAQYKTLKATGAGMVYSPYVHARQAADGSWTQVDPVLQYRPIPANMSIRQCMVQGFFTVIPGMLFTRAFWLKVAPWRTDMVAYEDWDLLWRIGGHITNPPHTADSCLIYRYHGAQTTASHQTNLQRDRQKFSCYYDAEVGVKKSELGPKYSRWDRLLLRAQIRKTLLGLKEEPQYASIFKAYDTPQIRLAGKYLQVLNKWNRMQTKTDWQIFHGAGTDPALFERYLKMV